MNLDVMWRDYEARNRYVNRVAWAEQPPCGQHIAPTQINQHRHKCKLCKRIFYPRSGT